MRRPIGVDLMHPVTKNPLGVLTGSDQTRLVGAFGHHLDALGHGAKHRGACERTWVCGVRSCVGVSDLDITIGITWPRLNAEATWLPSSDLMLVGLCPVNPIGVSGQCLASCSLSPTALFHGGFYLSPMAGSSSLSWPFALT